MVQNELRRVEAPGIYVPNWVVVWNILNIFTPKIGERFFNFDEHIFQMGGSTTN